MKILDNKKAFTLIELLVVIAVLAILVLLAVPRFLGHTQNAELTKGFANARTIEKASELYYMDDNDWPRLTDEPYTSEEVESYSERIFDKTGHEVNLDPDGNYYDIDYDKLSDYVQVPDDKKNYILQNPVGKVFYMDNLNESGIARVNYSSTKEGLDPIEEGLMNPIVSREPTGEEIAIDSSEELAKIGEPDYPLNGKYVLTSDINLSDINWTPIGNDSSRFTGSFDGNGYKIINLTIDKPSQDHVGLFGRTDGATIKNVALEDVDVKGGSRAGGLVGWADSGTTISNSYATGSVEGKSNSGGLVGHASSITTISNSYATGSVTGSRTYSSVGGLVGTATYSTKITNSYSTGSVTGSHKVGGFVGSARNSTIENSYATGSVKGTGSQIGGFVGSTSSSSTKITNSYATGAVTGSGDNVGGFVGWAEHGTITNSYATGQVTGNLHVGGFVGSADYSTIENSYWNKETTGKAYSDGGKGKATEEMKLKGTFEGWDFTNIWEIIPGSYPTLR